MPKPVWTPLDISTLDDCAFIACDPSLTAAGLVIVTVEGGKAVVHEAEKLATTPSNKKGWEDTFYRAELMEALLSALLNDWVSRYGELEMVAVHEAPPTGGGSFTRTEASILTGYAFRLVASEYDLPVDKMVTPQSHKKLISGNHIAKKPEHHIALKRLSAQIEGYDKIKNEAQRDALSIGLYAAWRLGEANA